MTHELITRYLQDFQEVGRDLYAAHLITSHGGNLSVWARGDLVITRTGAMLHRVTAADLCVLTPDVQARGPAPSMDTPIHQGIYRSTRAEAVVHAHPRHAIALSLDRDEIVPVDLEGSHHLGRVPVVDYRGGSDVVELVAGALREHRIVMVRGHGSYARGDDLWQALQWTTVLEESAQVLLLRGPAGGPAREGP
jgi:L-fuculose-phosphate aldolase